MLKLLALDLLAWLITPKSPDEPNFLPSNLMFYKFGKKISSFFVVLRLSSNQIFPIIFLKDYQKKRKYPPWKLFCI